VIVPFDQRARIAAVKVHARLGCTWQSTIIDTRERKHVYVIAVAGLTVQSREGDSGRDRV
jgi:hypothetical protein